MSFVAAGAIIVTPMNPAAPQQEPSHPLVRNQQVQLAASVSPITVHNVADNPAVVHVLAEASRTFQSAKTTNATSAVGGTSVSPSVARTKVAQPAAPAASPAQAKAAPTGAVTTRGPETGDEPSSDAGESSTAGGLVTNALYQSGSATSWPGRSTGNRHPCWGARRGY
jgi:hypothetical protein